ncbi:ribosomal RNA small subunit methyltransferase, chloroplastic isoform X2 [Vigna radiata var. radiata]|uniref:rRNA adenine N(6)-methyltransferase n=1 Tax=Vigna radiata var. radiata TaxID=3916 RepID=A0A3Q0EV28_VIGRR|nr:ribosomal RNA small subunit methyltransferase, chloroplastic isoform X2 [Vigna radiata var. radiata]
MNPSSLCSVQTFPPISQSALLYRHRKLAHDSTAGVRRRAPYLVCAERSKGASMRSADDYHATLKALKSKGRFPRKSLGQHYMLNSEINDQLAGAAGIEQGDVVLEIGPGTGSLTNVLLNSGAFVLAVEKDKHMAALVSERFSSSGKLKVLTEDIVKCHVRSHMSSLVGSTYSKSRNAKEETAVRLVVSSLRTPEYRPINVFVNFYSEPEYKFKVPRTNFFPQPNVDAAVVSFKLKQPSEYPHVSSTKSFFSMVNSAFNEKRKMLRKSLQHICTSLEIEEALTSIGLLATSRPEELTLDDFVKLHNLIAKE